MAITTGRDVNRADILLLAIKTMTETAADRVDRPHLEALIKSLSAEGLFEQYFPTAMIHRIVIETLAYLDQNHMIRKLELSKTGQAHLDSYGHDLDQYKSLIHDAATKVDAGLG